jgi:hypothetical protein
MRACAAARRAWRWRAGHGRGAVGRAGLLMPYVHGGWALRIGALAVLVSAGVVVYGIATLVWGPSPRGHRAAHPPPPGGNPSNNT